MQMMKKNGNKEILFFQKDFLLYFKLIVIINFVLILMELI